MAIKRDLSTPLSASLFDKEKRKRSKRVYDRSEKVAAKGRKAVDEGRDKKATRLLKKAARLENRSINIEDREDKKRKVSKGTFDVEVDGKSYPVKGKKVVKTRGDKTITKFKAKGGKGTPVKRIKDKEVKKGNLVIKNKKKTKYRS
tara:strand:- start:190 stop:627 length:438 start_codon:yes stop_codon:yes gene_type:complete